MSSVKSWIKEKYQNSKITTMQEMTKKIAGVSKVRVGKNRTINSYYEITLNEINEEGLIVPHNDIKKVDPANESAIITQKLHSGDLVFPRVFTKYKSFRIGRMEKTPTDYVVANNSMIKISFDDNQNNLLPKFIQYYLQHPMIYNYLYSLCSGSGGREQISINDLKSLPVPVLTDDELSDIVSSIDFNIELQKQANLILEKANKLYELQDSIKVNSIFTQNKDTNNCDFKQIDLAMDKCLKELLLKELEY